MTTRAEELVKRGQAMAESLMTLTLAVFEPTGQMAAGEDGYEDWEFVAKSPTIGKVQGGSVQAGDPAARTVRIGGVDRLVLTAGLHIPVSAEVPVGGPLRGVGWEYLVTAVGDADPALLNRRYMVVSVPAKSYATARRLDVVEV